MTDLIPIQIPEPPIVALNSDDDLTIWRFDDGSVVLRLGPALNIGAETILFEAHQLAAVVAGLTAAMRGNE